MKGIVFNLLEDAVARDHGPDGWCDLIDAAGVSGIYTSLGSYPDEELFGLVNTAAALMGNSPADVLQWFGRAAMPMLASRYGELFVGHDNARSFVLSVNDIIHPEVRKLYSGAGCPNFHFRYDDAGRLLVSYQSPRGLCRLAHGFIEGASDHFGQATTIEHLSCMQDGAPACRMAVAWTT